jgi:hypothetical protein
LNVLGSCVLHRSCMDICFPELAPVHPPFRKRWLRFKVVQDLANETLGRKFYYIFPIVSREKTSHNLWKSQSLWRMCLIPWVLSLLQDDCLYCCKLPQALSLELPSWVTRFRILLLSLVFLVIFFLIVTNIWDKQLKEKRFILVHGFRVFGPWSALSVSLDLRWGRTSW